MLEQIEREKKAMILCINGGQSKYGIPQSTASFARVVVDSPSHAHRKRIQFEHDWNELYTFLLCGHIMLKKKGSGDRGTEYVSVDT